MRRAGDLFDGVADFGTLIRAARRAALGKKDRPEVASFLTDLEHEVLRLQRELLEGSYRPGPYRTFRVRDPKPRTISAAPFRDRVVHHAICAALEPVLERFSVFHSYACRKGKGTKAAVLEAQRIARGRPYFLKIDVRRFYETADHAVLRGLLRRRLKDRRFLALLDVIIDHGAPGSERGKGLPIGNLTSQHLANLYLGALDHHVTARLGVRSYTRYMDDCLMGGDEKRTLWRWHDEVERYLAEHLRLELRDEATRLAPTSEGIPFLGFRIWPSLIRFDGRRKRRYSAHLRAVDRELREGRRDEAQAARSATSLVGWSEHADTLGLRVSLVDGLSTGGRA